MTRRAKALLIPFLAALGLVTAAAAQDVTTSTEETSTDPLLVPLPMSFEEFAPKYRDARWDWHRIKDRLCRSHYRPHEWPNAADVHPPYREERLARARARRAAVRELASRCLPTSMTGIIRYVFPSATEDAAIRVADCESGLSPTAQNPSGASGLFQLMPTWWAGVFNPFDPWANTRFAYRLSDAGYNWSHWVCKP